MPDTLLTPAAVAELYHVHPATVARWLRDGTLRGEKPGHDWVIPEDALRDFKPPARGPRPAPERKRLLEQAQEMVAEHPGLLAGVSDFDAAARLLAKRAGPVNLERCRSMLAKAIRQARYRAR